jgi:hypothetical protein
MGGLVRRSLVEQDPQQIAHLMLLGQGMGERQLGLDLVAVSSPLPLTYHVALVDQLGDDSVGGALGDPNGCGDFAEPDARVTSHADKDMRVVGQKVPPGGGSVRALLCHTRKVFHELVIQCAYGTGPHQDSSGVADASRFAGPVGLTDTAAVNRAGGVPTSGGMK